MDPVTDVLQIASSKIPPKYRATAEKMEYVTPTGSHLLALPPKPLMYSFPIVLRGTKMCYGGSPDPINALGPYVGVSTRVSNLHKCMRRANRLTGP